MFAAPHACNCALLLIAVYYNYHTLWQATVFGATSYAIDHCISLATARAASIVSCD